MRIPRFELDLGFVAISGHMDMIVRIPQLALHSRLQTAQFLSV